MTNIEEFLSLSASELVDGERRLEAGVYLSPGFIIRHKILNSKLRVQPLSELANIWQPSRLKGIQVGRKSGTPFLVATQVFDIWPTPRKWLAPSKTPHLSKRYVEPGWILMTCSGSVGHTMITYSIHEKKIISHDLLRLQVNDPGMLGYIYTFLRTKHGRAMVQSSHYGNIIKHLEDSHVRKVLIPTIETLIESLGKCIASVFEKRDEAYQLNLKAWHMFSDAMKDIPDDQEVCFSINSSEFTNGRRRLEAYFHNSTAQSINKIFNQNTVSVTALGDVATAFVVSRFKRIYGEKGAPYLDSDPIFKINPPIKKFLKPATKIDFSEYFVKEGSLLMACSGQIYGINGRAILVNKGHEEKVLTQHIMRIVPINIRPGYLEVVLSHLVFGKPMVVSKAYGTSVPELDPEDIEQLPIPRLDNTLENEISDAAENANKLRMEADELENDAVRRLEEQLVKELGAFR